MSPWPAICSRQLDIFAAAVEIVTFITFLDKIYKYTHLREVIEQEHIKMI